MFATIESAINDQVLDQWILHIGATPTVLQQLATEKLQPALETYMVQYLQPYPRPIGAGVFKRLATPKQIRYVMAKIRRGEWTGRTGGLGRQWRCTAEPLPTGAVLRIRNLWSKATYVVGDRQQAFHADTGWPVTREHVHEVTRIVRDTTVRAYFDAANQKMRTR